MARIHACSVPTGTLLADYAGTGFVDCYAADVGRAVSQAEFVAAFYTGRVFKLERLLLRWFAGIQATDEGARQLAAGTRRDFAAWTVEGRTGDQLLMCDLRGRTRSWFMVAPLPSGAGTRLYFGSAVVPGQPVQGTRPRLGAVFTALLGFHKVYSKVLLGEARARVARVASPPGINSP